MTAPGRTEEEVGAAALETVLRTLRLDRGEADTFLGGSLPWPRGRVYGGQVLAQALLAAGATVPDDRLPHSVHGYFLRAGDPTKPITFAVERLRDGRSFSARRTHAIQDDRPILSMISSFQLEQDGLDHAAPMPDVPSPDEVTSVLEVFSAVDDPRARDFVRTAAFDLRHVTGSVFAMPVSPASDDQAVWMRSRVGVEDALLTGGAGAPVADGAAATVRATSPVLHAALMAFACDQILLEPVLRRHGLVWITPGLRVASLDHAMWWHRPVRVDEWLLYVQHSPSARGGRALGTATVYAEDGTLVASIAQEGMVRVPEPPA